MSLHGQIINLQCGGNNVLEAKYQSTAMAYKIGHRDARHAAAEMALKADACIDALSELDKRMRECAATPASVADAYDTFYRDMVSEALKAVG